MPKDGSVQVHIQTNPNVLRMSLDCLNNAALVSMSHHDDGLPLREVRHERNNSLHS